MTLISIDKKDLTVLNFPNKVHKIKCVAVLMLSICVLLGSCAKQGFPSGGQKDTAPPVVITTTPANCTTNFEESLFFVGFNEYVVIKDADNNILVSPPMNPKPEYSIKGHDIVVKLRDSLQSNTTYLFQFKEAIADFNEGNLLPSYEYVFSTGKTLDSMCITGQVLDALTRKPRENVVSVMLLSDTTVPHPIVPVDSLKQLPSSLLPPPAYVTRCDKQGNFDFNYIKPGVYFVVAMEDEDKNLRLSASESVAFKAEPVEAWEMPKSQSLSDSTATDSVGTRPVGSQVPISAPYSNVVGTPLLPTAEAMDTTEFSRLLLLMSQPNFEKQRVVSSDFIKKGCVRITSQLPMVAPRVVSFGDSTVWVLNRNRDTLTMWALHANTDSVRIILTDSSGLQDTLKMRYHAPKKTTTTQLTTTTMNSRFPIITNFTNTVAYFDTLQLRFSTPTQLKFMRPIVYMSSDSIQHDTVAVHLDSSHLIAYLDWHPSPGKRYFVKLLRGSLVDLYGNTNDSLSWRTESTKPDQYSNLTIKIKDSLIDSGGAHNYIVELLDEKGVSVQRRKISTPLSSIEFSHLKAGKYRLRAIVDVNANGKWDAGNYGQRLQPEEVFYFKKTLEVREKWDFVEQWVFPKQH